MRLLFCGKSIEDLQVWDSKIFPLVPLPCRQRTFMFLYACLLECSNVWRFVIGPVKSRGVPVPLFAQAELTSTGPPALCDYRLHACFLFSRTERFEGLNHLNTFIWETCTYVTQMSWPISLASYEKLQPFPSAIFASPKEMEMELISEKMLLY